MMIRGNRMRLHIIGGCRGGSVVRRAGAALLLMAGLVALALSIGGGSGPLKSSQAGVQAAPADDTASYLGQAKKLLDSGTQSNKLRSPSPGLSLMSSSSDRDPYLEQQLRQSIKTATDLINNYRQNGLTSLPSLPNLPGVNTVMRLPDKLLRAELSMIQDEIRMAMEMMNNPLAATMNAPRDISAMFYRMAEQLEQ